MLYLVSQFSNFKLLSFLKKKNKKKFMFFGVKYPELKRQEKTTVMLLVNHPIDTLKYASLAKKARLT